MPATGFSVFLATGCGLGRFRYGGTLASVAACFAAVIVQDSALPDRLEFAGLAVLASAVCLACGGAAEAAFGRKDPLEVVADEFAGMWLALAIAPPASSLPVLLAALVAFRILDGAKPFGIGKLQKIPGAAGILVDDLVAGAGAGAAAWGVSLIPALA
ncbi:MAG: phosphatidylglycerophosphatase A [Candidatus Brocadiae bacterium]|nr:phosphatidylglycerophosphatase A [Candidatus Brocadiia bacterium]